MKTIIIICFLGFSVCLAGQEGIVISGEVSDETTGELLSYATIVFVGELSVGTTSDISGSYRLNIPDRSEGNRLLISCIGYNDISISVDQLTPEMDFSLVPRIYSVPDVIVRPSQFSQFSIGPVSKTIALDSKGEPLGYAFSHFGINLGVYVIPSRQQAGAVITSIDYFITNRGPVNSLFLLRILIPDRKLKENHLINTSECYDHLDQKIVFSASTRGWNRLKLDYYDIRFPDSPFFLLFIPLDEGEESVWYDNGEKRFGSVIGIYSTSRIRQMKMSVDNKGRLAFLTERYPTIPALMINCGDGM